MKQTAVEWLQSELNLIEENKYTSYIELKIKQAKAMEKEQISEAYRTGVEEDVYLRPLRTGEQYYEETFKSE